MLALISGVAKAFGEVLFRELKLWLKERVRRRRKRADLDSPCGSRIRASVRAGRGGVPSHGTR
jgi:hypothetical protein